MIYNRYVQGGKTEYNNSAVFWWDRKNFKKDISDIKITISNKHHRRPDWLADDIYGSASLSTFVMQYNDMMDVMSEFVVGAHITLPTPTRLDANRL
jgi:hypothetical protein